MWRTPAARQRHTRIPRRPPGVRHAYRVKAINSSGLSGVSNFVRAEPKAPDAREKRIVGTLSRQTMIAAMRHHPWWLPVLIAAAAIVIMNLYSGAVAHAAAPPGDCWNGALSEDPAHCYALEEVQRDGLIEVQGVYLGAGPQLYVYYAAPEGGTEWGLREALREKAAEFGADHANQIVFPPAFDSSQYNVCSGDPDGFEAIYECMVSFSFYNLNMIPWSSPYGNIGLRSGGAESRLQGPRLGIMDAAVAGGLWKE